MYVWRLWHGSFRLQGRPGILGMPKEAIITATDTSKEKNRKLSTPERQLGYVRRLQRFAIGQSRWVR